ncbi:MAG TPA: NfeD family protein [Gaiellaceae bacterium]|jgi:membrane-bound serine protease (ClpP class)
MVLLLAILLAVLVPVAWPWNAVLIIAGCLLEIVEVLVLRRWSHRLDRRLRPVTGSESMIGQTAEVVAQCRPLGQVRVHGELWEARCEAGADPGETVRVDAIEGLALVVSPGPARAPQLRGGPA